MIRFDHYGFATIWEEEIYAKQLQLNRYPNESVVITTSRYFSKIEDKSKVRILDMGCGAGNNLWFLSREGYDAYGIDGSKSAIDFVKKRLASEALNATLSVGDISQISDYFQEPFDLIIDRCAMNCMPMSSVKKTVNQIKSLLKPGGIFYSQFFHSGHPDLRFGEAVDGEPGTFGNFKEGVFKGEWQFSCLDESSVKQLFYTDFTPLSAEVLHGKDEFGGIAPRSVWNLILQAKS